MKITRQQLRRIIKEELLRESVDTDVYEGDHDPLTVEIPALEDLATEENFDGKKVWHSEINALGIASVLEEQEPDIEDYNWNESQWEKAKANWNKIHSMLDGWGSEDKKKLASNIKSAIKSLDDKGYGY